jgi:redox-sensitive bicupin YhaK (pirin superfamily)
MSSALMKKLVDVRGAAAPHWVGDGFYVRSAFTYDDGADVLSPFLLLDYGAPRKFAPTEKRRGVGPHPHRGFETVTVAYEGEIEHRDSTGGGGVIGAGDVQWMTAGAGIVHEEFHSTQFAKRGGTLHMVQLWVNLPAAQKGAHARYQSLLAAQIPSVALPDGAGDVRVIAGQFGGSRGPARTFTPIDLWNVTLRAGKRAELALPDGHTTAFLLLSGEVAVAKRAVREGELAVFSREGASIALEASRDSALLVMSGQPIDEPIVGYGPFVMNTPAEIEQAFEDYQGGRMGTLRAS